MTDLVRAISRRQLVGLAINDVVGSGVYLLPAAAALVRGPKSTFAFLLSGAAVSRLVKSTRDADLVQVNDAVFRIRRARRNCEAGWVALACQDYHAVAAGIPGQVMNRQMFPCARLAESASQRD